MYAKWFRELLSRAVLGSKSVAVSHLVPQIVQIINPLHLCFYFYLVIFFLRGIRKQKELGNQVSCCHKMTKP